MHATQTAKCPVDLVIVGARVTPSQSPQQLVTSEKDLGRFEAGNFVEIKKMVLMK